MSFNVERQRKIFDKTDGRCHICRKKLVFEQYGSVGDSDDWEVEHSRPKAKGGTDHLNNLYASCIPCNRSKGASSTRVARQKHGNKAALLSKGDRRKNMVVSGLGGQWLHA